MTLRALIVDDEYPARQELRFLLEQFQDIEIVGEAAGAMEAYKLIQVLEYDILFLDIHLPGINGLELTAKFQELPKKPQVIFITAYDNYAVDAFAVDAADYIMKPINKVRLKRAIDKVKSRIGKANEAANPEESAKERDSAAQPNGGPKDREELITSRIIAELKGRIILVDVDDIYFAYTEGDLVYLKTHTDKLITKYTLKELDSRLNKVKFFRTHRSFIVNIHKVKEIQPFFNGTYNLVLDDKEHSEVPVSRNQAKKLRKVLGY